MTMKAVLPGTMTRKRLEFKYDYIGRRVEKIVKDGWTGSTGTTILHRKYVYDGWNLIAELDGSTNGVVRTFLWGLDLSGTVQGAGGVGGLLMIEEGSAQYLAAIDGGGNVTGLIDKSDGSVAAVYEYGPYGEPLRAEGPYAAQNPFRFSTKYTDSESGLVYFGLRYYEPTTGRFINRDPIGEAGGLNLYGFVGNDPINRVDFLGLTCADDPNGCGGGDDGGGIVIGGRIDITGGGSSNNNVPNGLLEGLNRLGREIIFGGLDDETLDNLENIDSLDSETRIETLILINDSVGLDGLIINEYLATTIFDLASYFQASPVTPVVTPNDQGSNQKDDSPKIEITISVGGVNSQGQKITPLTQRGPIILSSDRERIRDSIQLDEIQIVVDLAVEKARGLLTIVGGAGIKVPGHERFIFVKGLGWIDLKHVVSSATVPGASVGSGMHLGILVEIIQANTDPGSAFAEEDFISNIIGSLAAHKVANSNGDLSLGEAVAQVIESFGVLSAAETAEFLSQQGLRDGN